MTVSVQSRDLTDLEIWYGDVKYLFNNYVLLKYLFNDFNDCFILVQRLGRLNCLYIDVRQLFNNYIQFKYLFNGFNDQF